MRYLRDILKSAKLFIHPLQKDIEDKEDEEPDTVSASYPVYMYVHILTTIYMYIHVQYCISIGPLETCLSCHVCHVTRLSLFIFEPEPTPTD